MKKILVIEDEQEIRTDILKVLKYEGFDAIGAENGRIGIQSAREHLPDLIVCDIIMPELNGYRVLAEVRSHPATAAIPFIFLTARATQEDMRKGMRLGADDYLAKPFTITELIATIQARLARHAIMAKQMEDLQVSLGANLPNEIRNLLTGIIGFAEFLTKPDMLPGLGELAEIGKLIYESGLNLQHLLENYLIYVELKLLEYKPERTNSWLKQEYIDTEHFLAFFAKYKARNAKRNKDLKLHVADAKIHFAAKSLQKIVLELLDNAFKFSPPGTPVHVDSAVEQQQFRLTISDQGRGISPEQLTQLSGTVQLDEDWNEKAYPGLGLSIARLLVKLQGGNLRLESAVNQGTRVTVILHQNG